MSRFPSWLISGVLHFVALATLVWVFTNYWTTEKPPLRLHFGLAGGASELKSVGTSHKKNSLTAPEAPLVSTMREKNSVKKSEQSWQALVVTDKVGQKANPPEPLWSSDDLLVPDDRVQPKNSPRNTPDQSGLAWDITTEGQDKPLTPPLPPAQIIPPGGAIWDLSILVPGSGGYPLQMEGLDASRPELDRWLEDSIKTRTFPPSLTGENYWIKWRISLRVGRPE